MIHSKPVIHKHIMFQRVAHKHKGFPTVLELYAFNKLPIAKKTK